MLCFLKSVEIDFPTFSEMLSFYLVIIKTIIFYTNYQKLCKI